MISVVSDVPFLRTSYGGSAFTINSPFHENASKSPDILLEIISVLFQRNNTVNVPIQTRTVCKSCLSRLLLQLFLNPNSCSPCYIASHTVLAERLPKSRNISPLEPNMKCQTCETRTATASAFHSSWHASFNVRPFPTPNRLRQLKKEKKRRKSCQVFPLGFVLFFYLCVFSPQYLFVPSSFLLFPPSATSSPLLLCTSNMSFFVFCTDRPFSLLNSPPSPLLWLSLSLSGA